MRAAAEPRNLLMSSLRSTKLAVKTRRLEEGLRKLDGVVVAFSGGVDSTFLAAVAHAVLGDKAIAVTARAPTFPRSEQKDAARLARRIGIRQVWIDTHELDNPRFVANPVNRCYFCKLELFRCLAALARYHKLRAVVDGSNLDDLRDTRPGGRAAKQCGVISPLREAGFTKSDIRRASESMGLPTADKPAQACLASRFPYGSAITLRGLAAVAGMEEALHRWGFRQVRVRHHGLSARIEAEPADLLRLCSEPVKSRILKLGKRLGFVYITADLEGYRTGSMNLVKSKAGEKHRTLNIEYPTSK